MNRIVETILKTTSGIIMIRYLFGYQSIEKFFTISIILLGMYYLISYSNGAVKGTLDPVFEKEVYPFYSARRIYLLSGITIFIACITLLLRFAENYYALYLPIISAALLLFALWNVDSLFHKTSDRRHLPMLYRLGIFFGVLIISCWIQ